MKFKAISLAWIIPLFAIAASVYALNNYYKQKGPLISVTFPDAAGIEPGKTELRYRGTSIGVVKSMDVTEDLKQIICYIQVVKAAELIASEGSEFWIVKPNVSLTDFRNIETIVSGYYIQGRPAPGSKKNVRTNKAKYNFVGIEAPDLEEESDDHKNDLHIQLLADEAFSLKEGGSILYKGVQVGEIRKIKLVPNGTKALILADINPRHSHLVRANSVFWDSGSFELDWGFSDIKIKGKPLDTFMKGGSISFATPEEEPGLKVYSGHKFNVSRNYDKDWVTWNPVLN